MFEKIKNKFFNKLSSQSSSEKETPSQELLNDKENNFFKKNASKKSVNIFPSKSDENTQKRKNMDILNDPDNIHVDSPSQKKLRLPSGKAGRILLGPEENGFFSTPNGKNV